MRAEPGGKEGVLRDRTAHPQGLLQLCKWSQHHYEIMAERKLESVLAPHF